MPELKGGVLRPSAGIQEDYIASILPLVRRMCEETRRELEAALAGGLATDSAMDENPSAQARMRLQALLNKYEPLFAKLAKKSTKRMISRTLRHSSATLGMSLREMSEDFKLKTDYLHTDRMQEVISASTAEATGLIKLIPTKYLSDVQGEVMRSITGGGGLKDLVPYLNQKYQGNIKHARNVAMDQTRKSYANINKARMTAAGIKEYDWLHVGGSTHPRPEHIAMSGKRYRFDDPPVVAVMKGREVRGIPGTAISCRCLMRPVLNFGED
jgi:SPP1 gp7 family putative phage head morphogenesis protein